MAKSAGGFQEIGVVEGFYGRVWEPAEREAFIESLLPFGLNTYLYAPKHETALGSALLEPLDEAGGERLGALRDYCVNRKIALWLGLHLEPPFDPAQAAHLERLVKKAEQLSAIGVAGIAVLFDDIPSGGGEGERVYFEGSLAAAQAHAFNTLHREMSVAGSEVKWMVCPGRYSLDPEIEHAHGVFERDYLQRLHEALPADVPWLWTGPRVCSPTISPADREEYLHQAGPTGERRPLVLWDNYPVNDAAMSPWLHLDPLGGRAPNLPEGVRGYLFNPMLQPALGAIPAATCLLYAADPEGYAPTTAWDRALESLLPRAMQKPFGELAALTRPAEPTGGLPPTWPRGSFPLGGRLQRAWQALSEGEPVEPYVVMDFRRAVETLEGGLPPEMLAEARPWLNRLRQVLNLFDAILNGAPAETLGPLRAQYVARDGAGPRAEVLGEWFP